MKRQLLKETNTRADYNYNIPPDLAEYVTELQLLYYVPLSYLIADEVLLPTESLRFFYVDGNWTEALTDGALSIGRVTSGDGNRDKISLSNSLVNSKAALHMPRYKKMHRNHKNRIHAVNATSGVMTGFVLRSELVRMLRGLEVTARGSDGLLNLLRLDIFSDELALGLFDGEITSLIIAEPKTGLTFGLAIGEHMLIPKDVSEENLGTPLRDKAVDINRYKNDAGRLDVSRLAVDLGRTLNTEMGAAKLAFELIAVANRAVFEKE